MKQDRRSGSSPLQNPQAMALIFRILTSIDSALAFVTRRVIALMMPIDIVKPFARL